MKEANKTSNLDKIHNPEKTCHTCGIPLIASGPRKYCSNRCRQKAYYLRKRGPSYKSKTDANTIKLAGFESEIKAYLMKQDRSKHSDNVKELRRLLAYSELRARAFEEMIDVASEMFQIDIRKKSGAKQ